LSRSLKRSIFVAGGYGKFHFGDDIILDSALRLLRGIKGEGRDLIVSSREPDETRLIHGCNTVISIERLLFPASGRSFFDYFLLPLRLSCLLLNVFFIRFGIPFVISTSRSVKDFYSAVSSSDVLYCVGGGYLTSRFRFGGIYSKFLLCFIFSFLGRKIIFSGQTVGPFYNAIDGFLAGLALGMAKLIVVRDEHSYNFLVGKRIAKNNLLLSVDDAIELDQARFASLELPHFPASNSFKNIGVCVHKFGDVSESFGRFLKSFSSNEHNIVFLVMQENDHTCVRQMLAASNLRNFSIIDMRNFRFDHLRALFSRFYLTIGTRYHLSVLSLNSLVPNISVYYDEYYKIKLAGLARQFGVTEFCLDDGAAERLISTAADLLKRRENTVVTIKGKFESEVEPRILAAKDAIAKILSS